jgi:hypothetical protein
MVNTTSEIAARRIAARLLDLAAAAENQDRDRPAR